MKDSEVIAKEQRQTAYVATWSYTYTVCKKFSGIKTFVVFGDFLMTTKVS